MIFRSQALKILLLFFLLSTITRAADLNYPYGRISLKLPPSEDPFPGMGNYYSSLSKGIKSVLWNPASLGKINLAEASLSLLSAAGNYNISKTTKVKELGGTFDVGAGVGSTSKATMNYALFFRSSDNLVGVGTTTKEIEIGSNLNYATSNTGINFSAAQKVNDWLFVGFTANNPVGMETALAGDFPITGRGDINLYGKTLGNMQISGDGKLKFTFDSGGVVSTPETVSSVWSGFLSQEVTFPFTGVSAFRNNVSVQSPYTGTVASRFGNFYAGINVIPISAAGQIDNDVQTVVNSSAADQLIYIPDFDPNNATEGGNWLADPDKYGTQSGYKRKQILLPAGEIIANAKYRGFYSGSATRTDFGMMYDVSEWFTVGMAMENIGGASINMKGSGLASYLTYREVSTSETDTLLLPGGSSSWSPFTDRWITTFEAGGTKLYLEPEKNYALPKKIRYGFALKRPFLIAVDFEQNQTPIIIPGSSEMSVSNLNLLRLGMESQVFRFPLWVRMGLTFMLKPAINGVDQATQDSINKYFQYGVLPLKFDFGSTLNLWGYEIGDTWGINALPAISLLQFDTENIDLSKMIYYGLSLTKDAWQINYLTQIDALSTAAAYGSKTAGADGKKSFALSDVKYVQTLGVTYKF